MIRPRTLETPKAETWRRAEVAPPWDYDIENLRAGLQVRFGRALLLVSFGHRFFDPAVLSEGQDSVIEWSDALSVHRDR